MSKSLKLALDIVIGAVVPILILKYATAYLGTLEAYLVAALIPVAWVLIDLFAITRRFNFITSYVGASAIMRGALAFWYVDGAKFAFKDSASYLLALLVFGLSALTRSPVTQTIALQGIGPDTPEREQQMYRLLREPVVHRSVVRAALIVAAANMLAGIANYVINYRMVLAPFNTPEFNDQVANVNAITRVVLVLPDMIALFFAFSLMYKAMYSLLPEEDGKDPANGDFWHLLQKREDALSAVDRNNANVAAKANGLAETGEGAPDISVRAAKKAREEFGLN